MKNSPVSMLVGAVIGAFLLGAGFIVAARLHPAPAPVATEEQQNGSAVGPESTNNYQCYAGICTFYRPVTCTTGSSTIFAVANPLNATTTAIISLFEGVGNATSTNLLVGTSTKSTGLASTDVSPTFANVTIGSTSPKFSIASGVTTGLLSAGVGTARILVAPGQYVVAQATSTYGGAGALNYTPGFTSCSARIEFRR